MSLTHFHNENKEVTWRHLKKGDKVFGYILGNRREWFKGTVTEVNVAFVEINVYEKEIKRFSSEGSTFEVAMTDEEFEQKYFNKAKEIVNALQNKLLPDEVGYHEMWNGWVSHDPYEMACELSKERMSVIGYIELDKPKHNFSGKDMDIGIACENADGERFWCHARSEYITGMKELFPELFN